MRNYYYIFGAHSRAQTFAEYMRVLEPERMLSAYLIDNDEKNLARIDGVPVLDLREKPDLNLKYPVYMAIRSVNHAMVEKHLQGIGINEVIAVTPAMDTELRNRYMVEAFRKQGRSFRKLGFVSNKSLAVYVACSAVDRPLDQKAPLRSYERMIQVGRVLMDRGLENCSIFDNTGDNISQRNQQFCELTALYWIWKNAPESIVGLEHYRRRFLLPDGWWEALSTGYIDVILPVPLYVAPSLEDNYLFRHERKPWELMMRILREDIETRDLVQFFEENGCYCPCNMLIARREIFDDLCTWLFPILIRVSDEIGEVTGQYQNRYPGFLAERLISFYFYLHEKEYRIVYSDKSFLQ